MSLESYQTWDRHFILTADTVQKRTLKMTEWMKNMKGEIMRPWKDEKYLLNEYAALQYIARHTTILVPRIVAFDVSANGCSLTTERLQGVALDTIEENNKHEAVQNCEKYIEQVMLPQLHSLRSNAIGGLTGDILPPERVRKRSNNRKWRCSPSSSDDYVFCHNDLAQHNVFVDPITLQVTGVIDWEHSGFYPSVFEAKLWKHSSREWRLSPTHEIDTDLDDLIEFLNGAENS